jgi:hypothetical protein
MCFMTRSSGMQCRGRGSAVRNNVLRKRGMKDCGQDDRALFVPLEPAGHDKLPSADLLHQRAFRATVHVETTKFWCFDCCAATWGCQDLIGVAGEKSPRFGHVALRVWRGACRICCPGRQERCDLGGSLQAESACHWHHAGPGECAPRFAGKNAQRSLKRKQHALDAT